MIFKCAEFAVAFVLALRNRSLLFSRCTKHILSPYVLRIDQGRVVETNRRDTHTHVYMGVYGGEPAATITSKTYARKPHDFSRTGVKPHLPF